MSEQKDEAQSFFSKHVEAYRVSPGHKTGRDLARLVDLIHPQPDDELLDVATAAGHTALAFAPRVRRVVGLDITPEMEAAFERERIHKGAQNATFVVGDVMALPFEDATFDIVTSRRAPHHFKDMGQSMREMVRVLRPYGRLGISDLTTPGGAAGSLYDDMERLRDSSHVEALSLDRWMALCTQSGLIVEHMEEQEEPVPWLDWFYPVHPDEEMLAKLEHRIRSEPHAVQEAILRDTDEGRFVRKRRVLVVAVKPGQAM